MFCGNICYNAEDYRSGVYFLCIRAAFYREEPSLQYLTNLWDALDFGSLESILLRLAAVFLCLTIHETCHGLAAYALGDPTAKRAHRLSLNPLRHIDWIGFFMMIVAGFGWAKPVPVNPNYFKKPKEGMAITALAGPVSNVLLALVFLFLYGLLYRALYSVQFLLDMIWLIKRCLFSMVCQRYESNDFSVPYRYICTSGFMLPCRTMRPARCSKSPGLHGASKSCSAINLS